LTLNKVMNKLIVFVLIVGLALMQSCGKDEDPTCSKDVAADKLAKVDQTKLASDIIAIDAFLTSKGIVAQTEPNGVRYVITSLGTGELPCIESRITVKYKGTLLSNPDLPPFDSNTTGLTFSLSGVILGWQLVLPKYVPVGTKVTLYIPSGYAYGSSVAAGGKIPANANLIFEIELDALN
jgi:FKBP-type peptidyl-prolyl cis-trans isomerase